MLFADLKIVGETTLNATNNWTYTFENLHKFSDNGNLIDYTVNETEVVNYTAIITRDNNNFLINNTHVTELVNVTVKKVWVDNGNRDGVRPVNVTVDLLRNGVAINSTVLSAANNWTFTFLNLDKYANGRLIKYTVNETRFDNYTASYSDDGKGNWTVTNTHITEVVNVTVKKVWVDNDNQDGVRPVNVTVDLLRNGVAINSTVLSAANNWTFTFLNLDKYANGRLIKYTVNETRFDNYTASYSDDSMGNWTVTNTHITEVVNVTVKKVWTDKGNQDGVRPVSVTVLLFADDVNIRNATLSASNNWTFTFEGLDKFKNNASLIVYRVNETEVVDYTANITDDGNGNWIINNTHVTEVVNVTVKKVWTDKGNQDGVRPVSVTVLLFADDVNIRNATLSASNNWTFTFKGLDKYKNNGTDIDYRVNETEVVNYNVNITGDNGSFVINNTHITELVNVTVVKVWNDGNNVSGKRPANITVVLLADGDIIRTATLNTSNDWTFTFEGLDKYKNNGTLIRYSIGEINVGVPGYTTKITNSTPYSWTVNNTYVPKVNKTANVSHVFYHDFVLYNITITNIGTGIYNETLTIVDSLPYGLDYIRTVGITGARVIQDGVYDKDANNVTWVITDINPNEPAIIFVRVGTYDIGNLTNNVTLIGPNGFKDVVNCTIEVEPIVDLSVNKTVDFAAHYLGDIVVWTIKVSNAYNGTNATDVTLRDILPAEFSLINSTATKGNYTGGIWYIGFMGNGTDETLVIYSRAINAVPSVTNYANVSCNETEWDYNNNADNATTSIILLPPPHKVVNDTKPFYHDNVRYNLTVINDGNYSFTDNIIVYDILPDGLEYIKTIGITGADVVANAKVNSKNNISWVIKNIKPHSTAVIEVLVKVNAVGNLTNNETLVYHDGSNMTVNCTIDAQPIVDVAVDKTVDNELHFLGDIVVWTIKVSNAYNGTNATDVTLRDILPAEFEYIRSTATRNNYANGIWYIGFMGNGTDETLVIYSRAKAVGTFINIANVTCNETDWDEDNNVDNATVTVLKNPDIGKTVNNTKPYHFECVEYYLTITNPEVIDYTNNLVVIDSLPEGLVYMETLKIEGADLVNRVVDGQIISWTIKNIKAKSRAVITVKVLANATGDLTNNATLVPAYGNNVTVNCTITPIPIADLEVIKLSDNSKPNTNTYYKGDSVTWTIIVINNGPDDAINAVATDFLPSGLIYISDDSHGAFDHTTGIWNIGNLSSGDSVTLNILTNISITNARIKNNVDVTSETYDPNETNNHDDNTITVEPEADLGIIKLVSQVTSRYNDIVTWTLIVINNGPDTAVGAVVSDKLPSGVVYVSDDSNGAYNHKTGVWKLGNLAKGQFKVLNIKTKVRVTNKTITNFANVTSKTYDPDTTNNKCNNSTTVGPVADLMLIKDVDKDTVRVGDKVKFTIIVKNLGPDTAVNTRAYDLLPKGLKLISYEVSVGIYDPVTGIWEIGDLDCGEAVEMTIVAEALVVGKIVNEAYVESDTYDNDTSNNYDNATVTVESEPTIFQLYPTGNPFAMMVLALFAIVVVNIRKRN